MEHLTPEKSIRYLDDKLQIQAASAKVKAPASKPPTSEHQADQIREALVQSSNKSIPTVFTDLGIPKTIIQNITDKIFCFEPYRLQMLQTTSEENKVRRANFSQDIIT
jgi:hypothetical protein